MLKYDIIPYPVNPENPVKKNKCEPFLTNLRLNSQKTGARI